MAKPFMHEPSDEMMKKIKQAREQIISQCNRNIRCPYCYHIALVVYADTTGFVKTKCAKCKSEIVVDLINMRRINHH